MQRFAALALCLFTLLAVMSPSSRSSAAGGVGVEYTVKVTPPEPTAAMAFTAVYRGATSPLQLSIGLPRWSLSLDLIGELRFSTLSGQPLTYSKVDARTVSVAVPADGTVVAYWQLDLTRAQDRGKKVESFGGKLSGFEALLVPENQEVSSARIKFDLPKPWTLVSPYPQQGEWNVITPLTFADLRLETRAGGWYFGVVEFDQTKTYPDGFKVRVVGFKGQPYRHWDATMTTTPLEEALKVADVYHAAAMHMKAIMGEYPYSEHLIVGPSFWQAGGTHIREQMRGVSEAEYIYHHVIHSYLAVDPTRMLFDGAFYGALREGYPTWAESIHTAKVTGDRFWRGMLYERKFHYLRGQQFGNLKQNAAQYVTSPIQVTMMDREIRRATAGKKTIDDLMAALWKRYNGPNQVNVNDEQVLAVLADLTGQDWHRFYEQYIMRSDNLDLSALDAVSADWPAWVKATSDYWYDGHPSMYILDMELVGSAGNQDFGVRWQPREWALYQFVKEARRLRDISQADLTEADVIAALHAVTGREHKDFFTFYRGQGLTVDVSDISAFVRMPLYREDGADTAARLLPDRWALGGETALTLEFVDPAFASAAEVLLQVTAIDPPRSFPMPDLISGPDAAFAFEMLDGNGGQWGTIDQYFWRLRPRRADGKTVASFTVHMPADAGLLTYRVFARSDTGQPLVEGGLTVKYQQRPASPAPVPEPGPADRPISVTLNGQPILFDVAPALVSGRLLVPVRALGEALGAKVFWDEASQTVLLTRDQTVIHLTLGQAEAEVSGQMVQLDVPAERRGGRVLVPLRFIAETFKLTVQWDTATQTAILNS